MKKLNKLILTLTFLISAIAATAQKLPKVQTESVYAPANIKIDGKPTEWEGKFQAYNRATEIYYTIANNNENLYLIIQATDPDVINKITGGGITLSINKYGNKKDKNSVSITYPVTEEKPSPLFILQGKTVVHLSAKEVEAMIVRYNKTLEQNFKWIKVNGIQSLGETVSIYNQDGIKAASLFDNKKSYTCELAIPLKYLAGLIGDGSKFTYHMVVNGRKLNTNLFGDPLPGQRVLPMIEKMQQMAEPTDFWGEYTLAGK